MRQRSSVLFIDGEVLWNVALSVYHPKRTSDWDKGREAGRKGCGQTRKENFAIIGRFVFGFWITVLLLFWKYTKFSTDWYVRWPPLTRSKGAMLLWGGFSVGFLFTVLTFFWKYIKFAITWYIIWLYFENLIFHHMGSPRRLFCPEGVCLLILSIWFLYFSESN